MSQEWNIRSRGHVCSLCQKPLVDKTPVISALREVKDGYERYDCHPECWKTSERDWEPFSQWDGVYLAPAREEKKEPLKKEDAGELLRQLVTLDDPAMKNAGRRHHPPRLRRPQAGRHLRDPRPAPPPREPFRSSAAGRRAPLRHKDARRGCLGGRAAASKLTRPFDSAFRT